MLPWTKIKLTKGGCADCGASEVGWASLNRGILICDDCCSVHRSLGRHVSQVKSLEHGYWPAQQLKMVQQLNSNGANNIWEHSLWDPSYGKSPRRKPGASDQLHPTKAEFIRSKHQTLAYVYRPGKDDRQLAEGDCSLQLHSSVRTANIETSLRLLSLGANANYTHPDRGTCPLHVAARAGQSLQAELLLVYGADPAQPNRAGLTPEQTAREAGYSQLADRLAESQYELTDRLAQYVTGQRPGHRLMTAAVLVTKHHHQQLELPAARQQLQQLSDHVFAELCADVYDELDRRENDQHWLLHSPASSLKPSPPPPSAAYSGALGTVPFLPVNPDFSSTRNQGRQKLARCSPETFLTLIVDLLLEARRRQCGPEDPGAEPLYDTVPLEPEGFEGCASAGPEVAESDYAELSEVVCHRRRGSEPGTAGRNNDELYTSNLGHTTKSNAAQNRRSSGRPDENSVHQALTVSGAEATQCSDKTGSEVNPAMETVRRRNKQQLPDLSSSASKSETFSSSSESRQSRVMDGEGGNHPLEAENLRSMVENLALPNCTHQLGSRGTVGSMLVCPARPSSPVGVQLDPNTALAELDSGLKRRSLQCAQNGQRLVSSECEPLTDFSGSPGNFASETDYYSLPLQLSPAPPSPSMSFPNSHRSQQQAVSPPSPSMSFPHTHRSQQPVDAPSSPSQCSLQVLSGPSQESVLQCTEQITRRIQRLLGSAQSSRCDQYGQCVADIHMAVQDMTAVFPAQETFRKRPFKKLNRKQNELYNS